MIITAYFSEDGSPKTGLSPTLDIIDLSDNSVVVNDGAMSEVGQGWYKYTFAGYDNTKDYAEEKLDVICTPKGAFQIQTDYGSNGNIKSNEDW